LQEGFPVPCDHESAEIARLSLRTETTALKRGRGGGPGCSCCKEKIAQRKIKTPQHNGGGGEERDLVREGERGSVATEGTANGLPLKAGNNRHRGVRPSVNSCNPSPVKGKKGDLR